MHRHGYKGRKFGREKDQRQALRRSLMIALFTHGKIETTEAKAKEIRRYAEKLVTRAKKGGLANRRLIIARLDNLQVANKLVDEIAPKIKRDSGYLRITRTKLRVGDNTQMAIIEFVDDLTTKPAVKKTEEPAKVTKETKNADK
ncbi:50S ribosomal protein L17 [Candidatus Saccharibacteria bacterium]|nr:50S ribosomal protein L17 [Candidatus Saccharibacteria bacterium]